MKKRQSKKNRRKPPAAKVSKTVSSADVTFKEDKTSTIELTDAYVMRGGKVVDSAAQRRLMSTTPVIKKDMTGSNQADSKDQTEDIDQNDIVEPPYNPLTLSKFLDVDVIHYRCVTTKVTDSIGRKHSFVPLDGTTEDDEYKKNLKEVKTFLRTCNDVDGFKQVLEKVDMDLEAIGWGAIEIVRSIDKKIRYVYHIPARRVRALRGHKGFAELHFAGHSCGDVEGDFYSPGENEYVYYLPFGEKLLSPTRKKIDGKPEKWDVELDGPIDQAEWYLRDRGNLNKSAELAKSANEILFIKKPHPKSIYYGIPDFIPGIAAIKGNLNIRDFFFQYFEHNAVPQYAVIVKGAHLKDDVKEMIMSYFSEHVKGQNHSTLVIPIPASAGGDVEVTFERLSAEVKEGSFQETKKNNQKDIIVAHGMSPAIIGIVENASLGSGKGTAQNEVYKNRIVTPRQEKWQRVINSLFAMGLGITNVGIEFEALDIADKTAQRENLVAYVADGIMSINEARKEAKLGDPVEGGDRHVIIRGGQLIFVDELDPDKQEELEKKRAELLSGKLNFNANDVNMSKPSEEPPEDEE